MNNKEITINGKQYPVTFDMQTMMNFEEITNRSFFESKFATLTERVALIAAAVFSADPKSDLTIEAIFGKKDLDAVQQIVAAFTVVSELMVGFFNIPEVEKKPDNSERSENSESAKN